MNEQQNEKSEKMKRYLFSVGIGLAGFVMGFATCYVCVARASHSAAVGALTPTFVTLPPHAEQPRWRAFVVQPTYPPKFQGEM